MLHAVIDQTFVIHHNATSDVSTGVCRVLDECMCKPNKENPTTKVPDVDAIVCQAGH